MRGHTLARGMAAGLVVLVLMGCAAIAASTAETPGERFEGAMKRLAEQCAKLKLPPNRTDCDPLKLKPSDPLATPEGRFAHSIKIPNPVPEDSGYRPGMTSKEYFDHLCKTEAGEFIYKTVEDVEGLYMMRPRKEATDYELEHLYALEDPYGYVTEGGASQAKDLFVRQKWYHFIEVPTSTSNKGGATYKRYTARHVKGKKSFEEEEASNPKSRHSYTWRGITRPHDRELGIVGGELIVLDLQANEVLAVRRGFIRSGDVRNNLTGVWWLGGHVCPKGKGRAELYTYEFVGKVVKPITSDKGDQDAAK